jgi:hypothetical protein
VYGYPYHYYDAFFIADPEAQLVIHFGSSVRLQRSVGVSRDLDQQPQRRDWRDLDTNWTLTPTLRLGNVIRAPLFTPQG